VPASVGSLSSVRTEDGAETGVSWDARGRRGTKAARIVARELRDGAVSGALAESIASGVLGGVHVLCAIVPPGNLNRALVNREDVGCVAKLFGAAAWIDRLGLEGIADQRLDLALYRVSFRDTRAVLVNVMCSIADIL
jgi:YD repeat-containing protein